MSPSTTSLSWRRAERTALPVYVANATQGNGRAYPQLERRLDGARWGAPATYCASWDDLERRAGHAPCIVVVAPWLDQDGTLERLARLRSALVFHPLVMVTARHPDNMRLLVRTPADEVVWLDELAESDLASAVRRATSQGIMSRLHRNVRQAAHLPARLRTALAATLDGGRSIRTVSDMASAAGRDRRTLWRWWKTYFNGKACESPARFLDWVVLLRALALKVPRRSWSQVAMDLGVHEDTLSRQARRTLDLRLSELEDEDLSGVLPRFVEVLDELISPCSACDPDGDGAQLVLPLS